MKAYKINLKNYINTIIIINDKGDSIEKEKVYKVKNTLAFILCHQSLKLVGFEFYKNGKLGDKILNCKDEFITLSQEDYDRLRKAFDIFQGFGRNDSELVSRIYEADQIELNSKE